MTTRSDDDLSRWLPTTPNTPASLLRESMASPAHCYYCFECLDASLKGFDPPRLDRYLSFHDDYLRKDEVRPGGEGPCEPEGDLDEEQAVDVMELDGATVEEVNDDRARPKLPSILRLQNSTSSSRSSSKSSPSTLSLNSSTSHLTESTSSSATSVSITPTYASQLSMTESYPLFVTWNTISRSGHKSLRGCIGTFEGLPLSQGLQTYSLTSAFDDTRFSPIPASLVPNLSCSLTLLANFEPCADAMDWTLGVHGLRISFNWRSRRHGATYLPDVAVEQGWTKDETLESLMKKAGWDGGYGQGVARRILRTGSARSESQAMKPWEEVGDFRVIRYTGLKASASYDEWQEFRAWVVRSGRTFK